ncbi:hypothetical protein KSF_077850 [Reticulibacter mediterranei]|uniref:Uncharacterized protein n=1 Tax=Reticulibacter mediterranei TaxID=2778369 RepID=A0A8J3IVV6_9CHLR|nr:hypothetical protein KSF_077850 [Reticulibacter mediterranei]
MGALRLSLSPPNGPLPLAAWQTAMKRPGESDKRKAPTRTIQPPIVATAEPNILCPLTIPPQFPDAPMMRFPGLKGNFHNRSTTNYWR